MHGASPIGAGIVFLRVFPLKTDRLPFSSPVQVTARTVNMHKIGQHTYYTVESASKWNITYANQIPIVRTKYDMLRNFQEFQHPTVALDDVAGACQGGRYHNARDRPTTTAYVVQLISRLCTSTALNRKASCCTLLAYYGKANYAVVTSTATPSPALEMTLNSCIRFGFLHYEGGLNPCRNEVD